LEYLKIENNIIYLKTTGDNGVLEKGTIIDLELDEWSRGWGFYVDPMIADQPDIPPVHFSRANDYLNEKEAQR